MAGDEEILSAFLKKLQEQHEHNLAAMKATGEQAVQSLKGVYTEEIEARKKKSRKSLKSKKPDIKR